MIVPPNRSDRGQNQLEYVGLVVLVGAVIAAIVAASAFTSIPREFAAAVCRIFSEDCPGNGPGKGDELAERPHEYYRPGKCKASVAKTKYGAYVMAYSVKVGADISFSVRKMSDGTTYVTAAGGGSVGGVVSAGADVSLGSVFRAGADASAEVEAGLHKGDTWEFDSEAEARDFIDEFKTRALIDEGSTFTLPGLAVDAYEWASGNNVFVPDDPDINSVKFSVKGSASGYAGLKLGGKKGGGSGDSGGSSNSPKDDNWRVGNLAAGVASAEVGNTGTVLINHEKDTRTVRLQIEGKIEGGVYVAGHPLPVPGTDARTAGSAKYMGQVQVTLDSDGNIESIRFRRTTALNNGLENASTSVTTELKPKNARQQRILQEWLTGRGALTGLKTYPWASMVPASSAAAETPFEKLLFQEASTTKVDYKNETDPFELSADAGAGLTFGAGVSYADSSSTVTDAKYLGAPRSGERGFRGFPSCNAGG